MLRTLTIGPYYDKYDYQRNIRYEFTAGFLKNEARLHYDTYAWSFSR